MQAYILCLGGGRGRSGGHSWFEEICTHACIIMGWACMYMCVCVCVCVSWGGGGGMDVAYAIHNLYCLCVDIEICLSTA